jgi:DMSO/TMAO reductase YedYZ molybdopterin-dependent catalytic subunit
MALNVLSSTPLNGETPLPSLGAPLTPTGDFYVRNNFEPPDLDPVQWRLRLHGRVERETELDLETLRSGRTHTRRLTLECAGNGRRLMAPRPPGTPWGLAAAGTASFTGVLLADLLHEAGLRRDAATIVFTGADTGTPSGRGEVAFRRSLPRAVALADVLVAWAMNDEPLTPDHGFPVRLVVPRYYAVASVKWLIDIEAIAEPFEGHFQTDRYVYRVPGLADEPVAHMRVRALVTSHQDGAVVPSGANLIRGVAWSGDGTIERVEVATGPGQAWRSAFVEAGAPPGVAVAWHVSVDLPPGRHRLAVRATDSAGHVQPDHVRWNELGYGNNAVQAVELEASDA